MIFFKLIQIYFSESWVGSTQRSVEYKNFCFGLFLIKKKYIFIIPIKLNALAGNHV